jgi:methylamine---glutamate N-methyltransferase subunit B
MEQVAASGERRTTYDARGLAEPHADVPHVSRIDGTSAVFDAAKLTTRQINLELRNLIYEQGITDVTVKNPGAKHSIGVGILQRCRITFEGSLGYFGVGLIDGPEILITGRVGWSVCENMMSGVVRIEKNAGSLTGAALRGGDIVVRGSVGARTGIDQKGGTIIVGGDAGSMTAFMMPGEWTDADTELIERKFRAYGLGSPPEFQKFVCGKVLYNYDNLEPSERKLVIH